jgi:hypothetical protein
MDTDSVIFIYDFHFIWKKKLQAEMTHNVVTMGIKTLSTIYQIMLTIRQQRAQHYSSAMNWHYFMLYFSNYNVI